MKAKHYSHTLLSVVRTISGPFHLQLETLHSKANFIKKSVVYLTLYTLWSFYIWINEYKNNITYLSHTYNIYVTKQTIKKIHRFNIKAGKLISGQQPKMVQRCVLYTRFMLYVTRNARVWCGRGSEVQTRPRHQYWPSSTPTWSVMCTGWSRCCRESKR